METLRGYRWGIWLFALVVLGCVVALPFAISCCSRFPAEDLAMRADLAPNGWAPGITPLAVALLDWPMGFRLLLMTLVAATLCLSATTIAGLIVRMKGADAGLRSARAWTVGSHLVLGSIIVGVLYIWAAYAVGYVGYLGPANALWMLGIPMAVALMGWPRLSGVLLTLPLAFGGWLSMAIISMTIGIPLD